MSPSRPIIRTYQGKRSTLRPAQPLIVTRQDPFDLLFGKHRTQTHVFSSSSEAATPEASNASSFEGSCGRSAPRRRVFSFCNKGAELHGVKKESLKQKYGYKSPFKPSLAKSVFASQFRTKLLRKRVKRSPIPLCASTPTGASTSSPRDNHESSCSPSADDELDADNDSDDSLARLCAKLNINTPVSLSKVVRKSSTFKKKLSLISPVSVESHEPHSSHMEARRFEPTHESDADEEASAEEKSSPKSHYESLSAIVSPGTPSKSLPVTPDVPHTSRSSFDFRGFTPAESSRDYVTVRRPRVVTDDGSLDVRTSMEQVIREDSVDVGDDSRVNFPLRASLLTPMVLYSLQEPRSLEPLQEDCEETTEEFEDESSSLSSKSSPAETPDSGSSRTPNMRRKSSRHSEERSPTGRSSIGRASIIPELNSVIEIEESDSESASSDTIEASITLDRVVLPTGKKLRRSLAIIRALDEEGGLNNTTDRGRSYSKSVEQLLELQKRSYGAGGQTMPVEAVRKSLSARRMSWMKQQCTPPVRRRSHRPLDRSALHDNRRLNLGNIEQVITPPSSEFRSKILQLCNQDEPCSFTDILPNESYDGGCKLGEGVFGEVFSVRRNNRSTVLKIMPVEGTELVNGENQKSFAEIYVEMLITQQLSRLRSGTEHMACGFVEVLEMKLVRGRYPDKLLEFWHRFDSEKGSDNDVPNSFGDSQLFIIIEQANGGTDLEGYTFSTANQALPIFQQVVYSLAVAEKTLEFEHRDLHVGNVLISRTRETNISFIVNGAEHVVRTNGVKATIIDYSLSRMTFDDNPVFCDLSKDPGFFIGEGDIQFDVYRYMKKDVGNEWHRFQPKTNVRWLKYLLNKMVRGSYQRTNAKVHALRIQALEGIGDWILDCSGAVEVAERMNQSDDREAIRAVIHDFIDSDDDVDWGMEELAVPASVSVSRPKFTLLLKPQRCLLG